MAKITSSPFTEDWLPIKQILNGMIQLENGEYVTGVKVHPRNIFIVDQGLQNAIIGNLRNFYNSISFEFWLIIADRPVDIGLYLSNLQILYNNTDSPIQKKLVKEKRMELIQKNLHTLISGLANSGLNSNQVSNDDLRMILDNFLNGGVHTTFGTVMS